MKYYKIVSSRTGITYCYSININLANRLMDKYKDVIMYEIDSETNAYRIVKGK